MYILFNLSSVFDAVQDKINEQIIIIGHISLLCVTWNLIGNTTSEQMQYWKDYY